MNYFTTIVKHQPKFNIESYSIHNVINDVMTQMLVNSPRGSKCRKSFELHPKDGFMVLGCTITLQNMKGTVLDRALVLSEDSAVARRCYHANSSTKSITCRECGHDKFYDLDRSLDYNNHHCAKCGHPAQTLTETGASA